MTTEPELQPLAAPPLAVFEDEALAEGERLFRLPCRFLKGVVNVAGLPGGGAPEVAFAGRSNVGKSSLLNAVFGRSDMARTSNTPGRTRELNFFWLGAADVDAAGEPAGPGLYLVDMPGYGYAKAPKSQVAGWNALIQDYLRGRPGLRRVFLLIDSRHGSMATDAAIMKLMDKAAVSYQIVLTKTDKLKPAEVDAVAARTGTLLGKHPAAHPQLIATSAVKGRGIAELRAAIAAICQD